MLTFAVVASRNGGRVSGPVLECLRKRAFSPVPFAAADHLVWSNDSATVWFGGWQRASARRPADHHWHLDDGSLTAFSGHLWPREAGWPSADPWAAQLARHLRTQPLTTATDSLAGVYVATSLHRSGKGAVGSDPLGFGLVYWGQTADLTVIASRAEVAAALLAAPQGGEPGRDTFGAGWVAYATRSLGLGTGFAQVSALPEGACFEIDASGAARLVRPSRASWLLDPEATVSPPELIEQSRAEMTTSIRMALASGTPVTAGLTGGKDSRLILALLLAAGRAGEVEFETLGSPSLPDVAVATEIADRFGLRHTVNPDRSSSSAWRRVLDAAVRAAGHDAVSGREIALLVGTWAASGARNIAKPFLGRPPDGSGVQLNGLCGEPLRASWPSATRFRSKAEVARFPEEYLKFGSAGILRPQALEHYRREVHGLLFAQCSPTDSPQDVIDAFYIRHWFRRWFGNEQEFDSQRARFPLYSLTALRLAFSIGSENRHNSWIHHQLVLGTCPSLLEVGFAKGGWPEGASGPLVPTERHDEPAPTQVPERRDAVGPPLEVQAATPPDRTVFRDRRAALEAEDNELMRHYLSPDAANPVFEILDPAATGRAIDRFATLPEREKLQLYGALTAAIWLGGDEIAPPRPLTPPPT